MADKSFIEWTDATWNIVTGCSRVSAGCQLCWAERDAAGRLKNHPSRQGLTDRHGRWNGEVRFNGQWLDRPLRWQRPRRIFVASSGDLFHPMVHDSWIDEVFAVMALSPRHEFQVLTKRPSRMRSYCSSPDTSERIDRKIADLATGRFLFRDGHLDAAGKIMPLRNVRLGVSAEDKPTADQRIWELLETPAASHWVSLEPLLGPICLSSLAPGRLAPTRVDALRGRRFYGGSEMSCRALDWVVVGGESGPGYRPMEPDWAREIELQCRYAGVAFFMKQMAGKSEIPSDLMVRQMPGGAS